MTKRKGIHKKTLQGMSNLQLIFQDKTNILRGVTKEELISIYYNIPINKIIGMKKDTIEGKWHEICTVKKYLRNTKQCAIDFQKASKGTILTNNEFGRRQLDRRRNIFFKIVTTNVAGGIRARYDKIASSFIKAGNNTYNIADEIENQEQIWENEKIKNRQK